MPGLMCSEKRKTRCSKMPNVDIPAMIVVLYRQRPDRKSRQVRLDRSWLILDPVRMAGRRTVEESIFIRVGGVSGSIDFMLWDFPAFSP